MLHGIAAALPVSRRQGGGRHLITTVSVELDQQQPPLAPER
jgi:hypothetical protein